MIEELKRSRLLPLAALLALSCSLAACESGEPDDDPASVPLQPSTDAGEGDGSDAKSPLLNCADEGCACEDGSEPKTCYPKPILAPDGTNLCAQGTMYCRDGKWSSCESLVQYELSSRASESILSAPSPLAGIKSELVQAPTTCNPCHPNCFTALDRPVTTDLTPTNATPTTLAYDPVQGGIRLAILENTGERGPVDEPAKCGNRKIESVEQCDDGNARSGDGCDAACLLEQGWYCDVLGVPLPICLRAKCGNAIREGLEQCDDGNLQVGDGCTFLCTKEPTCDTGKACDPLCGDGKIFPGEACDDGNTTNGDGCSSECKKEPGWVCTDQTDAPPAFIDLPVVYRDFVGKDNAIKVGGLVNPFIHLDFENLNPGYTAGLVQLNWETDKLKPTYKKPIATTPLNANKAIQSAAGFNQWYTDDALVNKTFADTLRVTRDAVNGTYVFDTTAFFPLDGKPDTWVTTGWEKEPAVSGVKHNFSFTSEVRFWFIFNPPQKLDFRGDDDVWVFINGRRAVDIGGVHGARADSISLTTTNAATFGLEKGKLYEAAVFQAERHTTGSNYRLTLAGFVTGKTSCDSVCGDGIVTPDEFCDDGLANGAVGGCLPDCQGRAPKYATSAAYWRDYAATGTCRIPPERPLWGNLNYNIVPNTGGSIKFELRGAETAALAATATPVTVAIPLSAATGAFDIRTALSNAGAKTDPPYLRVTVLMTASVDQKQTPVLRSFDVTHTCVNVE